MSSLPDRVGFTLVELVVVMAIMAVLVAITLPIGRTMIVSNHAAACAAQMRMLGQVMRVYYQDYQGVPPRFCNYDAHPGENTMDTDENLTDYPAHVNRANDYTVDGRGLMALIDAEYLNGPRMLHCPVNTMSRPPNEFEYPPTPPLDPRDPANPLDALYAQSYTGRDPNARTGDTDHYGTLNQYKYLSIRGVYDTTDPDYRRQLCKCVNTGTTSDPVPMPQFDPNWHPDDSTVVLWCNWHEKQIYQGGFGQYLVLFWDGSVRRMPNYLFHEVTGQPDPPTSPPLPPSWGQAAWRVHPSDDTTP